MLSIKKCKKILEDNGNKKYTEEEVKQIRALLYKGSQIVIEAKEDYDETLGRI